MKAFKITSHPYTLIFCFLFILISGEHWGGFYITYLLTALPFGRLQSLLGFAGVIILLISYHKLAIGANRTTGQLMNILGVLLFVASLVVFFKRDTAHYNWGTLEQGVPLFTIYFTAFIAVCFLIGTFWKPRPSGSKQGFLSKV